MKARITLLTLGVEDLDRAVAFYRDGLGFPTQGIVGKEFEYGAVAFFDLQRGLKMALWPRSSIARDANVGGPSGRVASNPTEFTIAHNVSTKADVDTIMEQAKRAGATITKAAADTFWGGYAGYFEDPDGHLW